MCYLLLVVSLISAFCRRFCTGDCRGGRGAASSPSAAPSPHGLLPPSHAPSRRVGAQLHWPFAVDLESGLLGLPMVSWLRVFPRVGLLGALLQDMQTTLSWGLLALLCSGAPFIARRGSEGKMVPFQMDTRVKHEKLSTREEARWRLGKRCGCLRGNRSGAPSTLSLWPTFFVGYSPVSERRSRAAGWRASLTELLRR